MPTISVTEQQARALARGENITVAPERKYHLIAVRNSSGTVYEVIDAVLDHDHYSGSWRILRYSSGRLCQTEGFLRGAFSHENYAFVEVPA